MRSSKEVDEPFIHASQAAQVFNFVDESRKHWLLVLESPKRSGLNVSAYEDPYVFTASANQALLISKSVENNKYWDGDQMSKIVGFVSKLEFAELSSRRDLPVDLAEGALHAILLASIRQV
ncbi:hypothetical protein MKW98_020317 [Papaver atlanticum]|uniref:Uncharacterized protein n=1 Tax=Papaver atlanticum TaxID=357466 RepID=A0AAD4XUV4_9MAGN|nr:hypothetical protein MKW98_020317 [Papaver atlanticum]